MPVELRYPSVAYRILSVRNLFFTEIQCSVLFLLGNLYSDEPIKSKNLWGNFTAMKGKNVCGNLYSDEE